MDPRYQVFVSSTFTDLIEERHAVREAILELGHFPAGMEIFPAADSTPWELIERIITESDYYVLIIGGRYGSVDEAGISFTEREFDLAQKLSKPVLAFVHQDPESIPAGKVESTARARRKLEAFKKKISKHYKQWRTAGDLKALVVTSLVEAIRTRPAKGWVRAGGPDVTDILARLANLQQRYDALEQESKELHAKVGAPIAPDLAKGEELVEIEVVYSTSDPVVKSTHKANVSWNVLFFGIAEELLTESPKYEIERSLNYTIARQLWMTPLYEEMTARAKPEAFNEFGRRIDITDKSITMIMLQFIALGLVETTSMMQKRQMPGMGAQEFPEQFWKLTRRGLETYLSKTARRSS